MGIDRNTAIKQLQNWLELSHPSVARSTRIGEAGAEGICQPLRAPSAGRHELATDSCQEATRMTSKIPTGRSRARRVAKLSSRVPASSGQATPTLCQTTPNTGTDDDVRASCSALPLADETESRYHGIRSSVLRRAAPASFVLRALEPPSGDISVSASGRSAQLALCFRFPKVSRS